MILHSALAFMRSDTHPHAHENSGTANDFLNDQRFSGYEYMSDMKFEARERKMISMC